MKNLKLYLELCKAPISLFAACSTATGFLLASPHRSTVVLLSTFAVFLLACGSSAFNQYQERDVDACMERTRGRPLPSGRIVPGNALIFSLVLMTVGLFLLVTAAGAPAAGLGLLAILWYNGLYTYLKKKTAFASVPGAVVGAIPPAVGWVASGGRLFDPMLFALCALFFLWQVPHFWLLVLRYGDEYERAGLPSLTRMLGRRQIARMTFVWIFSTAAASLALPLYGLGNSRVVYVSLLSAAAGLVWIGAPLLSKRTRTAPDPSVRAFSGINGYLFFVMLLLAAGRVFDSVP